MFNQNDVHSEDQGKSNSYRSDTQHLNLNAEYRPIKNEAPNKTSTKIRFRKVPESLQENQVITSQTGADQNTLTNLTNVSNFKKSTSSTSLNSIQRQYINTNNNHHQQQQQILTHTQNETSFSEVSFNADNSFENIYRENKNVLNETNTDINNSFDFEEITETNRRRMMDNNNQQQQQVQHHQQLDSNEPRKDHYSYSYSYKTSDPESGQPGLAQVEVNESVTEEIGPDGSKIIRRHQQEKQVNKITQVVTQRVIKRQYIDPTTGQIIEYDPNNELFANLPPETVFEEHTVVSDENGHSLPVVTTTTTSKSAPNGTTTPVQQQAAGNVANQFNGMKISETDYVDRFKQQQAGYGTATASFRIKSHPEDNQGYPEERNMDYDPDDINCYPDDDLPYEGLIQSNCTLDQHHGNNGATHRGHTRGSGSNGSTSSSSSPALFDSNSGIDMPLLSNTQHFHHQTQISSSKLQQQHRHH